jgi:transposase
LRMFCGIDWAEAHHDVALVDGDGTLIAKRRISDDAAGFTALITLLADAGDSADDPIPVASETPRGLLVAALRATGRKIYPINPKAVDRYRDRYTVARKKSDAGDALVLANILRTDLAAHRPLPADSELAQAIAVLARAQQDAVWERTTAHNKLRSLLREYYPALLDAFTTKRGGLQRPEARALLATAPTPRTAAKLTTTQLTALLRQAGRQRGINAEAARIQAILRTEYLHQLPLVEDAFGRQALALVRTLDTACTNAEDLAAAAIEHFDQHPDAEIITSLPGLGSLTGARVLARDRRRSIPLHHRQGPQGLRRCRTRDPGQRQKPHRDPPPSQEPTPSRRRLRLGLRRADRLTRRPSPLRPSQDHRRPPHRRPTQPVQSPPRLPAPLPAHPAALQRTHRLPHHPHHAHHRIGLTS